jgi:glutathione S-transferase
MMEFLMILTVHHLNHSRSQRILWLLEELGVDYELKRYERDPKTRLAPKELRQIHPLGKSPVITDKGITIAESGAIIEYLLDEYDDGTLRPEAGTSEFLRYRYWLHYAEGSAMTPLLLKVVFNEIPRQAPKLAKPILSVISKTVAHQYINPQMKRHMGYWEEELEKTAFFSGGTFTAADIQMSFPLEGALSQKGMDKRYPRMSALLESYRRRPAYGRALERGGVFSLTIE